MHFLDVQLYISIIKQLLLFIVSIHIGNCPVSSVGNDFASSNESPDALFCSYFLLLF